MVSDISSKAQTATSSGEDRSKTTASGGEPTGPSEARSDVGEVKTP